MYPLHPPARWRYFATHISYVLTIRLTIYLLMYTAYLCLPLPTHLPASTHIPQPVFLPPFNTSCLPVHLFMFTSMVWGCISTLRPQTDLLFIPMVCEYRELQWNDTDRVKLKNSRKKTCPSATSSTTNPTWSDSGANPATYRLSHGTAFTSTHICTQSYLRPPTHLLACYLPTYIYPQSGAD
jgi:hypothetical protein